MESTRRFKGSFAIKFRVSALSLSLYRPPEIMKMTNFPSMDDVQHGSVATPNRRLPTPGTSKRPH